MTLQEALDLEKLTASQLINLSFGQLPVLFKTNLNKLPEAHQPIQDIYDLLSPEGKIRKIELALASLPSPAPREQQKPKKPKKPEKILVLDVENTILVMDQSNRYGLHLLSSSDVMTIDRRLPSVLEKLSLQGWIICLATGITRAEEYRELFRKHGIEHFIDYYSAPEISLSEKNQSKWEMLDLYLAYFKTINPEIEKGCFHFYDDVESNILAARQHGYLYSYWVNEQTPLCDFLEVRCESLADLPVSNKHIGTAAKTFDRLLKEEVHLIPSLNLYFTIYNKPATAWDSTTIGLRCYILSQLTYPRDPTTQEIRYNLLNLNDLSIELRSLWRQTFPNKINSLWDPLDAQTKAALRLQEGTITPASADHSQTAYGTLNFDGTAQEIFWSKMTSENILLFLTTATIPQDLVSFYESSINKLSPDFITWLAKETFDQRKILDAIDQPQNAPYKIVQQNMIEYWFSLNSDQQDTLQANFQKQRAPIDQTAAASTLFATATSTNGETNHVLVDAQAAIGSSTQIGCHVTLSTAAAADDFEEEATLRLE